MTLSAQAIQRAPSPRKLVGPVVNDESHAIELVLAPGQVAWLTDEDVLESDLPPGAVKIDAPIAQGGLPSVTISPGLTSGEATISSGTYKILDDKNRLDVWFQEKLANGYQLFGGRLKHYIFPRGTSITSPEDQERALAYTWLVRGEIKLDRRVHSISVEDISRDINQKIFTERSHTVLSSITAEDNAFIEIYIPPEIIEDADDLQDTTWLFEHGPDYHVHPGERRAIGLIQNGDEYEFISWTLVAPSGLSISIGGAPAVSTYFLFDVVRGLFGTTPKAWSIDEESELASRLQITAVPYAEEHPLSMALACLTGKTADGRAFSWGLDREEHVDVASFPTDARRRTYRPRKSVSAKRFVEEQCLARRGLLVPNAFGKLAYRSAPIGSTTAAPSILLSEANSNIDNDYVLTQDESETASGMVIKWDQDFVTGDYRKTTQFILGPELQETSATEPVEIEAPYYSTGLTTESEVMQDARVLYARYARPVKRMTVSPNWDLWQHLPGEIALASLPVKDYAVPDGTVRDLFERMMLGSVTRNHNTRQLTWNMIGFRALPPSLISGTEPPPDEFFTENGVEIQSTGGVANLGQTLVANQKYYTLEPQIVFPPGFFDNLQNRGTFRFWCKGVVIWTGKLDVTGRGGAGGDGAEPGAGASGEAGYVAARPPSGSVRVRTNRFVNSSGNPQGFNRRSIDSRPPAVEIGTSGTVTPSPTVTIENNRLVGAPANLHGAGGSGGDGSMSSGTVDGSRDNPSDRRNVAGSNGGSGSGGVELVCAVGSGFSSGGEIILDGVDGQPATRFSATQGAAGAGGAHGVFNTYQFGQGTPWVNDASRVKARHGKAILEGDALESASFSERGAVGRLYRSFYDPDTSQENEWQSAASVILLPTTQAQQDIEYSNAFDETFADIPDGNIRVFVQDDRPSDGNRHDLWITKSQLDNGGISPVVRAFLDNGYETVIWEGNVNAAAYRAALSMSRDGGNRFFYGPTRPAEFQDNDVWLNSSTGTEWTLFNPPGEDQIRKVRNAYVGEELIEDANFSLTALGQVKWVATRDANLQPINVAQRIANEIASVFITHGLVTGEYSTPETEEELTQQLLRPPAVSLVAISDSEIDVRWALPSDTSNIENYRILRGSNLVANTTTQPYRITGLQPDVNYTISVASRSSDGSLSTFASSSVTTPSAGGGSGQIGIQLTDAGRSVRGTAWQDNGGGVIGQGRGITLTLSDGSSFTATILANGMFEFNVPAGADANLGQQASIYTNNGDDSTRALLGFVYEL